jgi:multisubunit Na+/H+ antiporter MnhG subunit
MRWLLGCLGVIFVIFGGCVLAIFGSEGVAGDEVAFAIGALLIFSFGVWAIYKAITMHRTPPSGGQDQPGAGPPQP